MGEWIVTTWIDRKTWDAWLDESGQNFDISQFYYEDDVDNQVRFSLVEVALWMEQWPEIVEAFLAKFTPDAEDLNAMKAQLENCWQSEDSSLIKVMREWITRHELNHIAPDGRSIFDRLR